MNRKRIILAGVAVVTLLTSGGVVASALNDLPQDAQPVPPSPTGELNRQPTPPAPQEPEPEAAPAPIAPVPITPAEPLVVVAEPPAPEEEAEDEAEEEETPAAAEPVVPQGVPGRRQRRRVAIVEAVDKVTAERMRFEVVVGGRPVRFQKTLIFTARACEQSAPDEAVEDSIAYLEVAIQPRGVLKSSEPRQIFRGWMFASSPAVNGLEHPIYDAWVVGCKA